MPLCILAPLLDSFTNDRSDPAAAMIARTRIVSFVLSQRSNVPATLRWDDLEACVYASTVHGGGNRLIS